MSFCVTIYITILP